MKENEDSLLKHKGIYKRTKFFPFLPFIVACSFPVIQAQEFSLLIQEKKTYDICRVENLRK